MAASLVVVALMLQAAPECRADAAAVKAVRAVADGIIAADNERNIDRVMGFYAADAWLMPPNAEPVRGHAAIRPRYESLFAGFDPAIVGRVDEACVSGSTAYIRGHNGGRMNPRTAAPPRDLDDAYLMLLRLDGGQWRISHLIWHSSK